jgi:hypothetical protein
MLNRSLAILAAIATGLCGAGIFLGTAPVSLKLVVVTVAALAATRTGDALVIVAALAPLGGALAALSGSPRSWAIPLVLALLFGAAIRAAVRRQTGDGPAIWSATPWIGLVALSLVTHLWTELPPGLAGWSRFFRWLTHEFPLTAIGRYSAMEPAVLAASGAALFALTATVGRRNPVLLPAIVRALVISVAAVGALNVNRLVEVAARRPPFLTSLITLHHNLRISAVFADVNAAGALFLLTIPLAFGFFWRRRGLWTAVMTLPWLFAGLWLSGSKTALALLPFALAFVTVLLITRTRPSREAQRLAALGLVALFILSALTASLYPRLRRVSSTSQNIAIRKDMVSMTLRMTRTSPWVGVGIGRYYQRSSEFMPESVRRFYRAENAHNQYLQVLGELGITGLAAFVTLLVVGLRPAVRRIRHGPSAPLLVALTAGA